MRENERQTETEIETKTERVGMRIFYQDTALPSGIWFYNNIKHFSLFLYSCFILFLLYKFEEKNFPYLCGLFHDGKGIEVIPDKLGKEKNKFNYMCIKVFTWMQIVQSKEKK